MCAINFFRNLCKYETHEDNILFVVISIRPVSIHVTIGKYGNINYVSITILSSVS